ncbi:hypothetical protein Ciccas_010312 [Cichlidogyrus casuarinus]|uniref:Uncharacterized protein n=1 Tax=Cichlidogyrus casuarinus TaxID=1844966 RepID=A0ABD2PV20_9PLAT
MCARESSERMHSTSFYRSLQSKSPFSQSDRVNKRIAYTCSVWDGRRKPLHTHLDMIRIRTSHSSQQAAINWLYQAPEEETCLDRVKEEKVFNKWINDNESDCSSSTISKLDSQVSSAASWMDPEELLHYQTKKLAIEKRAEEKEKRRRILLRKRRSSAGVLGNLLSRLK